MNESELNLHIMYTIQML